MTQQAAIPADATPPQAIGHIDHVGILVRRENVDKYVALLSGALGITFEEPLVNDDAGVIAVLSWGSGFEIVAPLREEGRYWERLQRFGEGTCNIVFGTKDIEAAISLAKAHDVDLDWEVKLEADTPWLARFKTFREARLRAFPDEFAATLMVSQIEPV